MSILKQLKTAEARIEELQAEIAGANSALAVANQAVTEMAQKIEQLNAEYKTSLDAVNADLSTMRELSEAQAVDLLALRGEKAEIAAAADKLSKAVAQDPALAQASAEGVAALTDGGQVSDGAKVSLTDQLSAIEDPKERRAFYLKNKAAIKDEIKKGA